MFEVYKQDDFEIEHVKATRYSTKRKQIAFKFMEEKNKIAGRNVYRVGLCINNRTAFDIDSQDMDNLKDVYKYYASLFHNQYKIVKSLHGYHLIGKSTYDNYDNWLYDECRILNPLIERNNMKEYVLAVQRFYRELAQRDKEATDKQLFLKLAADEFRASGLFFGHGDFDVLFSISALHRGMHCIRISKKCKEDMPKEVFLFP